MRILHVGDEPNAARMLAKGLREEAYAVDIAGDGESALEQAYLNDYDLVILDVMMPRKGGFEVCQELRAATFPARERSSGGPLAQRGSGRPLFHK